MSSIDAALLGLLREARFHCPASELAARIPAGLAEVRARIAELQAAGFTIEEHPAFGYRLLDCPDRLIADDLHSRLGQSSLVREILVFEETDSTNDAAASLGRSGSAGGVVVFAERQLAGRGRFGRRWVSASHLGLWSSLLLRPVSPLARWPRLTTCAAVAVAGAIADTLGLPAEIKWPNDVLIAGKKVAGMLTETGSDREQRAFAVLGIGINVNHSQRDFPEELAAKASSLREFLGHPVDRSALAVAILRKLQDHIAAMDADFEAVVAEAARRSSLLGRWVQVHAGEALVEGIAESLDEEGHLLIRTSTGLQRMIAGEVSLSASPL